MFDLVPPEVAAKVTRLFAEAEWPEVVRLLDEYGAQPYQTGKDVVQMAVLRLSNGKVERVRALMATARADYRDVLLVAREPNGFRVGMMGGEPPDAEARAAEQDVVQWDSWLAGRDSGAGYCVCEQCAHVGIILAASRKEWLPCPACGGTGEIGP